MPWLQVVETGRESKITLDGQTTFNQCISFNLSFSLSQLCTTCRHHGDTPSALNCTITAEFWENITASYGINYLFIPKDIQQRWSCPLFIWWASMWRWKQKKKKTFWEKLVMPMLTPETPVMITATILMKFYWVQVLEGAWSWSWSKEWMWEKL